MLSLLLLVKLERKSHLFASNASASLPLCNCAQGLVQLCTRALHLNMLIKGPQVVKVRHPRQGKPAAMAKLSTHHAAQSY